MMLVQKAISESEYPIFLYSTAKAVPLNMTLGNPMANQVVGTHRSGEEEDICSDTGKQLVVKKIGEYSS
jgi:hypothetical protein